jgi:predicted DNA-binding transcriptional regulator AlpA
MTNDNARPLALRPREAAQALSVSEKALWNLTQPAGLPRSPRYRAFFRA